MIKGNAPCKCSHSKANHLTIYFEGRTVKRTIEIGVVKGCSVKRCGCLKFKMDNLKYLEKEYDAQPGK